MTTGYIVQVHRDSGTVYVGTGGKIGTLPKIFNNSGRAKAAIRTYRSTFAYGNQYFHKEDIPDTVCIKIEGLEKGMRGSDATEYSWDAFIETDFSKSKSRIPNNPKAIYKIQLGHYDEGKCPFVNVGPRKEKFGRTWNTAGAVRSHINANLRHLYSKYLRATVLEIEMDKDGITPKVVKTYSIVDFYCASEPSRKSHDQQFPNNKYTTTPERT